MLRLVSFQFFSVSFDIFLWCWAEFQIPPLRSVMFAIKSIFFIFHVLKFLPSYTELILNEYLKSRHCNKIKGIKSTHLAYLEYRIHISTHISYLYQL